MPSQVAFAAISSFLLVAVSSYAYFFSSGKNPNKIHQLGSISVINAWAFFNKRYDFLRSNFDKTGHDLFSFKVLQVSSHPCDCLLRNGYVMVQYQVVAMSGEEARKTFFNEKGLNFTEGYRLLMGGVSHVLKLHTLQLNIFMSQSPNSMKDIKDETSDVATFNKRLHKVLRRDRLQDGKSFFT